MIFLAIFLAFFSFVYSYGYCGSCLYDVSKSFEENCIAGPVFTGEIPPRNIKDKTLWKSFLGYTIASPIGVPACAIMTSKGIHLAAQLGFDVLTYKTIRSDGRQAYPTTNISYVDVNRNLTSEDIGKSFFSTIQEPQIPTDVAVTNSFGNASPNAQWVSADIKHARELLEEGQILIVSVFGEQKENCTQEQDFVKAARIAYQAGAQIIEANLSCPNLDGEMPYKNHLCVASIVTALVKEIPLPIIIKVGVFDSKEQMRSVLIAAAKAGAQGICGINAVPIKVVNQDGTPYFGKEREISGLSGAPIFELTKQFVQNAREIITQENLNLALLATGGVTLVHQFTQLLDLGADIVLSGTGMMWNPYLAYEYHLNTEKQRIFRRLYEIGAIKFGNFVLKSGQTSPIYFDLRVIVSYPDILQSLSDCVWQALEHTNFDCVCGVPYTALPIATAISLSYKKPMIMQRKEAKEYGTKKMVEGVFKQGDTCLVIEDVITTGGSILQTIKLLEQEGLNINHIFVCIDRQQGGMNHVVTNGYSIQALFTITEILAFAHDDKFISDEQCDDIIAFITNNQCDL